MVTVRQLLLRRSKRLEKIFLIVIVAVAVVVIVVVIIIVADGRASKAGKHRFGLRSAAAASIRHGSLAARIGRAAVLFRCSIHRVWAIAATTVSNIRIALSRSPISDLFACIPTAFSLRVCAATTGLRR